MGVLSKEKATTSFKKGVGLFSRVYQFQWSSQVIGIGRAPALRLTIAIALTTLVLART